MIGVCGIDYSGSYSIVIGKLGFVIDIRIGDKGAGFEVETIELKDSCVDLAVFGC